MSDIDDIDLGGGGLDDNGFGDGGVGDAALAAAAGAAALCLACGHEVQGPYCSRCGQKNDDLRRSSFLLARNFLEDTFSFDSRMWRTLGLLAKKPGEVPRAYAHGQRSQFTPPVRLFLLVSFLFFLTIGLTNTLFLAIDVQLRQEETQKGPQAHAGIVATGDENGDCGFHADLRFFVPEKKIANDKETLDRCFGDADETVRNELEKLKSDSEDATDRAAIEQSAGAMQRIFNGVNWAVTNPKAFNSAFNVWLPRVMFLMTPILALILALFIRGKEALIFDHLVLSLYTHAAGFVIIGVALILTRIGIPYMGPAAFLALIVYYAMALKRAYGRGWIKTIWTVLMSGFLYQTILIAVVVAIVGNIIWDVTKA